MRSIYKKLIEEEMLDVLSKAKNGFESYSQKSAFVWPGTWAYVWKPRASLWIFFVVVPDPRGIQSFTLELGWSKLQRFPEKVAGPDFASVDRREFGEAEFVQRVGYGFIKEDIWWYLEPADPVVAHFRPRELDRADAEVTVNSALLEVSQYLNQHIFPYVDELLDYCDNHV